MKIIKKCRNEKHRFSLRTKPKTHFRKSRQTRSTGRSQEFGVAPRGPISTVVSVALRPSGSPQGHHFLVKVENWSSFSGALFHIGLAKKASEFECSKKGPTATTWASSLGPGPPPEGLPMRATRHYYTIYALTLYTLLHYLHHYDLGPRSQVLGPRS